MEGTIRGENVLIGTLSGGNTLKGGLGTVIARDGKDAYELAVKNGFEGTEAEWLASLKGEKGDKGDKGDTGSKGDTGAKGDKGDTGAKGDPFTYSDFTSEQLAALKGAKGDKGDTGSKGDTGVKGDKGDTGAKGDPFTYSDFTSEQLAALKGAKGDKGDKGDTGESGVYYGSDEPGEEYDVWINYQGEETELLTDEAIKTALGYTPADEKDVTSLSEAIAELGGTLVEPAEDDIPKVFFGGALQQTKDEAVVPFRYISKTQDISGYAEIKAQGNLSMSYPKKNQTVKMFEDEACETKMKVDFKGWGKQNKHVYKANWIDLSHARNVVSARLWGDVVKSRANYAELPELLRTSPNQGAVDGFPVKVYAAGVYQGRYTLNIPKDKWAFNMDNKLDNHCVLCGEGYNSGCFRQASVAQWTDEIHDVMPESIKSRWIDVINFVMTATDEEFKADLGKYFDVPSLIDYHLFGLASCGIDAYGKNQLYITYDGQKWIASMYDMDSTWGLFWHGGSFVATDYPRTSYEDFLNESKEGNLLYIRLEQNFHEELQARWAELKNGALHIDNIINRFERFTDIAPTELVKEDYASTTGGGVFTGIPQQGKNNIQQLRGYALARLAYVDTYVEGLSPVVSVPCTGVALSDETLTFTAAGSKTLTATITPDGCTDPVIWKSNNITVAHVTSGEIVTVGNGECEITATCGNYSATCAVSVSGVTSDEEDDENLLYSLSETEFDGTQASIDTGVKLHDVEKDYTVFVDFTNVFDSNLGGEYKLFTSETYTNGSWVGHKLDGAHGRNNDIGFNNTRIISWQELWGKRHKFVFKVSSGKLTYAVNINGGGVDELTEYTGTQNYTGTSTYTAKIAYKYCGTVHSVKIWNGAKSDAECLAMVNS